MGHPGLEFTGIIEVQVMKKALGYALWLFALLALVFGTVAYVAVGLPWKPRK